MTNIDFDKYKYKYDLHVHTSPVSNCGQVSVYDTVRRYADIGFTGIVITNHFNALYTFKTMEKKDALKYYMNDFLEACESGKSRGLDVFLGFEMRFPESMNDYLVYGVECEDAIKAFDYIHTSYENFYSEFKNEKNLIVQAHPFRSGMILKNPDVIDGIEVFNMHPGHNSRVEIAAKYAKENPSLIITGGTDFHHETHEGMCGLCTKEKIKSSTDVAKVLKSKDYIFDVWGQKIIPHNMKG